LVPAFILDPELLDSPYVGDKRVAFLFGGLRQLDADLQARGSRLVIRCGEPLSELRALLAQTGATRIFSEEDFSPYARRRDARVAEALPLQLISGVTVHPPGVVLKADGAPYTVFTPFSRAWKELPVPLKQHLVDTPNSLPAVPNLASLSVPDSPILPDTVPFLPGEAEGQRRLRTFVDGEDPLIHRYAQARDRLDWDDTSHLSPYLRFGMVSARKTVVSATGAIEAAPNPEARKSAETWLNELIWREFYINILHHFPQVCGSSFRPEYDRIAWENDAGAFEAWCEGRTGYAVVDAAMRQLVETGWMHNRARMIVASFLVKDLLIDWRWGERFFMQHLVDGDPAANNGGWQWTAGTGTDAAPYFRIFNPVLQGKKHDPDGVFARRWLPELARMPDRFIHEPWKTPLDVQRVVGCVIAQDYPAPLVEHAWARERTLGAYRMARETEI
jgi:deoxyribodipyrimidine photo-lyase